MALRVKNDKALYPVDVRLFGSVAEVFEASSMADLIKELRFSHIEEEGGGIPRWRGLYGIYPQKSRVRHAESCPAKIEARALTLNQQI